MFYYPQFLGSLNLINIQVVFPGGWGLEVGSEKSRHFLLEHLLFAPLDGVPDTDEWLWENVVDFWSITSYESIRLNFTLKPEQVSIFIAILEKLIQPRNVNADFVIGELEDLKNFWQTRRDQKEDQILRALFPNQNVVHPSAEVINNLSETDLKSAIELWKTKQPHIIVLGEISTDDIAALSGIGANTNFLNQKNYQAPTKIQTFSTSKKLGWSVSLQGSHTYELLLIELWDQVFETKFFFEYHQDEMFIWTEELEYPHLLAPRIEKFIPSKNQFAQAKHAYIRFLEKIYHPHHHQDMQKLAELIEGLHGHEFQAATYQITPENLDLREVFSKVKYEDFLAFYKDFFEKV